MKLKKGDEVIVVKGKDRGKTGKVERVFSENRLLIPNVNQYKRHQKRTSEKQPSEIVTITKPISCANVALICPQCHHPTRVGFKTMDGEKMRICRKCKGAFK